LRPGCRLVVRTFKKPGKSWTVVLNEPGRIAESRDFCQPFTYADLVAFGDEL
jgi:hypothetical protein